MDDEALKDKEPEVREGPYGPEVDLPPVGAGPETGSGDEAAPGQPQPEEQAAASQLPSWKGRLARLWAGNRRLVVVGLVVFCLGAASSALLLPRGGKDTPSAPKPVSLPENALTRKLEPFIFAGRGEGEGTIFKIGLALEFSDDAAVRDFDRGVETARRDIYQYLSQGVDHRGLPERKAELQEQVRQLINAKLGPGRVVKVYFSEFLAV